MSEIDREQQEEEMMVIESMYGEEAFQKLDVHRYTFLPSKAFLTLSHLNTIKLQLELPSNYPSISPPNFKLIEDSSQEFPFPFLTTKVHKDIEENFRELFIPGEVVLFTWLGYLEEYLVNHIPSKEELELVKPSEPEPTNIPSPTSLEASLDNLSLSTDKPPPSSQFPCHPIYSGTPIEDRKSVFIAHVAEVNSIEEVDLTLEFLLQDRKIAKATHNISAYRILSEDGTVIQDNDDDGETAAGSRLLHLLQVLEVRNVLVVVSRWYGGIQLGPDRFKHINNAARQTLEVQGYLDTNSSSPPPTPGHAKKKTTAKKR